MQIITNGQEYIGKEAHAYSDGHKKGFEQGKAEGYLNAIDDLTKEMKKAHNIYSSIDLWKWITKKKKEAKK